jgi:hypothetical protein
LALVTAAGAGCVGGSGQFSGAINGSFFEPTGTVFAFPDNLTPVPDIQPRDKARMVLVGVYSFFDPAQDQSTLSGSDLAELKHEIETNDWIVLEWKDKSQAERGRTYKAYVLRDDEDNLFRVQDASMATEATAGFAARVRFRRPPLNRNSPYRCPFPAPPFLCDGYRPLGSRITVETTLDSVSFNNGGSTNASVVIKVEKRDGDPSDAQEGTFRGTLSAVGVSERVAETNLDTLGLYGLFKLPR